MAEGSTTGNVERSRPLNIGEIRLAAAFTRALLSHPELSFSHAGKVFAKRETLLDTESDLYRLTEFMEDAKKRGRVAVSNCIRRVEAEFGIDLVDEEVTGHSTKPAPDAHSHLLKLEHLISVYDGIRRAERDTVRISAIDSAINHWIPEALGLCGPAVLSSINIHCETREWWKVIEDVRTGLADFGIAADLPDESVCKAVLLRRPHVAVFSDTLHELTQKKEVTIEDFNSHGAICLHQFSAPVALESHIRPDSARIIRVNTNMQAAAWAARNLGIALLVEDVVPQGYNLTMKPLSFEPVEACDCIYSPRKGLSGSARSVHDAILAYWECKMAKKKKRKTQEEPSN